MPGIMSDGAATQQPIFRHQFQRHNVAINQAASALNEIETAATSGTFAVTGIVMPFAGSLFAIAASFSAAVTAGSFTAQATINGTASTVLQVVMTTGATGYVTIEAGPAAGLTFNAGDTIGVKITTNGTFAPTTSDLAVDLYGVFSQVYY